MSNFDERDALTRELRNRSHDIDGGHPIALDSVKRRARKMKRRRQLAGGAAAAVVVAIAVPTAFALARQSSSAPQQAAHQPTVNVTTHHHAAKQSQAAKPSATAKPTPQLPAGVHVISVADAASGSAPRIGYLDGSTVRDSGGSFALPKNDYLAATPYHGGYLAAAASQGGETSVVQVDGSRKVISSQPGGNQLAISADGTEAAYFLSGAAGKPGTLRVGISSGMSDMENTQTVPAGVQAEPVGFVSGGKLAYQTDGASPKVYVTGFHGSPKQVAGLLKLGGTDQMHNLVAGETQYNSDGTSCWAVLNASTGAEHWKGCDYALGKFSSDGKYVVGVPSQSDGLGPTSVAILDASNGHPVATFQGKSGSDLFFSETAWDSDTDSLLAIAHENGSWRILRLGTDGSVQGATGPVAGPAETPAYRFVATP